MGAPARLAALFLEDTVTWQAALAFAPGVAVDDIDDVIASSPGAHAGAPWLAVLRLLDGRYVYVGASTDEQGWAGAAATGCTGFFDSLEELAREYPDDVRRLGLAP